MCIAIGDVCGDAGRSVEDGKERRTAFVDFSILLLLLLLLLSMCSKNKVLDT